MKEQLATLGVDILKLLSPVFLALLGLIGVRINQWVASKTKNENVAGILYRLNTVAMDAVKEVYQTYISALTETGSLTPEAAARAKTLALQAIKAHMGTKGLAEVKTVLGINNEDDLMRALTTILEARVLEFKLENATPEPNPSVIGDVQ